ncbi:MAG: Na/Pi cotransporter family protein [Clostridiales bacterium]|nr:Na/Pi cotransporter family protein [Clostridiales bacterium]
MSNSLRKRAAEGRMGLFDSVTKSPLMGFLIGIGVTALIQSSSASTVMVVGFVNSGMMSLLQAIYVIFGANIGTVVTSWLMCLSGIEGGSEVTGALAVFKTSFWVPIIAVIATAFLLFSKKEKVKDTATVIMGFAVMIVGMEYMTGAVSGLSENEEFTNILTVFNNPLLGVLAGVAITMVVQSSAASIGILQSLTTTGAVTYGMAIPIIVGQNIGTCITAILSSIGANTNAKRTAMAHLMFNIISALLLLPLYYLVSWIFSLTLGDSTINMIGVAGVHTIYKVISAILWWPFAKLLEKLVTKLVRTKKNKDEKVALVDERILNTPAVAVIRCKELSINMNRYACDGMRMALDALASGDLAQAKIIREYEETVDQYEDQLGSFLIKVSGTNLTRKDSAEITEMMHLLSDIERISDHSVDLLESVEEMKNRKIEFSEAAKKEVSVMAAAIREILDMSEVSFAKNDVNIASNVEPLEQVVDYLKEELKRRHVIRLQNSQCTMEHGFVLSDILTNLERVSDHCSNIAGCVIEIAGHDSMDMHSYLRGVKTDDTHFKDAFNEYLGKYTLD